MGQTSSNANDSNLLPTCSNTVSVVETLQEDIVRHARQLTEIGALTYEDFQTRLMELNQLAKKCVDTEGNQLIFAVKKGTDKTLLWKGTVRIACVRFNDVTTEVVSFRLMTLIEFLKVFKTLVNQFAAAEQSRVTSNNSTDVSPVQYSLAQVAASLLMQEIQEIDEATRVYQSGQITECCICLERKTEVLLPCAHSYCLPCIEQWNVSHKTCPICREALDSTDDTWVISEAPGVQEICGSLMELAKGTPPNT